MKFIHENYQIITDEKQFIVQKKKITQAGRLTKEENIGKETFVDLAYYTTLNHALKHIGRQIVLDTDDLKDIKRELIALQNKIDDMTDLLEISGDEDDEN